MCSGWGVVNTHTVTDCELIGQPYHILRGLLYTQFYRGAEDIVRK